MESRCTAELHHRWAMRAGIGLLLAIGVAPISGQVGAAAAPLVDRCRELLSQCALVLRAAGAPLRWLPAAILVCGLVYAVADRVRLSRQVKRFLGVHRRRRARAGEAIHRESLAVGVEEHVRVLVGEAPNPAFTAGILRPRIFIAERLQDALSADELRAVIRHECCHLRRRDPLRFALLRFAAKTFFWLPVIGALADELMDDAEILADDFASSRQDGSDPLDVASALVKIGRMGWGSVALPAGAAGVGGLGLLERRVHRLVDPAAGTAPRRLRVPWRHAALSAAMLGVIWTSSTFPAGPMAHGMTMQWRDRCPHDMRGTDRHCPECETRTDPMGRCPEMAGH